MQTLREPSSFIAPDTHWAKWELPLLLGLLAVYLGLATYRLHLPGLYYDEILFVGPAAGERPYVKFFGLPLLIFPYIGALKSWSYTPIFAVFGVSPVSIRLPAILISCGTLALGYVLTRRILTPKWAVAFTAACAVHPGFVLLTRVDLGPIVLMLFLKALCLVLLFKWIDNPQTICWPLFAVCILGFFDKFNFVWFIVALAISTSVIYGPEIFQKLRTVPARMLLATVIALIVVGLIVLRIVYPLLQRPPEPVPPSGRFSQIWSLYESMCTGSATAYLWFKSPPAIPSWMGWSVLPLAVTFMILTLVGYGLVAGANKNADTRTLRFCLWSLLMFGIIFLEITLTPQAGGPHHMIMLFPFDLLAAFSAGFLFANRFPGIRRPIIFLESCVLILWMAFNLKSFEIHFNRFRDANSFRGRWSPHIEVLAAYLNERARNVDAIYPIDWGIGFELAALCRPEIGRKVKNSWGAFQRWSPGNPDAEAKMSRVFPPAKTALYVSFVPEESVFPEALENFERMRVKAGNTTRTVSSGQPAISQTYQIFEKPAVGMDQ